MLIFKGVSLAIAPLQFRDQLSSCYLKRSVARKSTEEEMYNSVIRARLVDLLEKVLPKRQPLPRFKQETGRRKVKESVLVKDADLCNGQSEALER